MEEEIWKNIKGYENYQVSNLGRVKSLKFGKEKILKQSAVNKYLAVGLSKSKIRKTHYVHKLVAIAFLNHIPCGFELVVDHKNQVRSDNRVCNLQIITARENTNKKHLKSSSQYVGVSRSDNKYRAMIVYKNKLYHLGCFSTELEASNAYQKALSDILTHTSFVK